MGRKLTIALHTPQHAARLQRLLNKEGINVDIVSVNLPEPLTQMPVAMEIEVDDVPAALRVIENLELFSLDEDKQAEKTTTPRRSPRNILRQTRRTVKGKAPVIILPVDFSDYSFLAARFAFPLAMKHGARVVLLHAFVLPSATDNLPLQPDSGVFGPSDALIGETIEQTAREQMKNFKAKLLDYIKEGIIPPVKFDTEILEGLPESVINEYARDVDPMLIVMGTRGANKKERELIGSITAEVLDTTRYPVFTVPETTKNVIQPETQREVAFFCNLDDDDITVMNTLYKLFPEGQFHITFYHLVSRSSRVLGYNVDMNLQKLAQYCKTKFGGYTFATKELQPDEMKQMFATPKPENVNFIVLANKRKHALARLFNPGLAHRLLFHTDIPMMAVPV